MAGKVAFQFHTTATARPPGGLHSDHAVLAISIRTRWLPLGCLCRHRITRFTLIPSAGVDMCWGTNRVATKISGRSDAI